MLNFYAKSKKIFQEFPKTFWVLILSTFIDRLGGFILFPFFAIYVSDTFQASMTQIGLLFMMMSIGSLLGGLIGGAVTDKIGRKKVIIFGLVVSGIGSIFMGLVRDLQIFYVLALILGFLGDVAGPARQAMIPDLLPKNKQTQGFGVLRVAVNISATVGPILGGLLAVYSYMLLFIFDALSSIITAVIVLAVIPETRPQENPELEVSATLSPNSNKKDSTNSFGKTFKGYLEVMADGAFMIYIANSAVMILVYMQMYSTLSVYLRNEHAFTPQMVGILMSVNALMVVVLQFPITRTLAKLPPVRVMALGTLCFGIGFGMFGVVNSTWLVFVAMAIVTIGEMITLPTSNGVVGRIAPADKRGRYMAVFSFSWAIPNLFGVILAGAIMDNINPNWVWYGSFILSAAATAGFLLLHRTHQKRFAHEPEAPVDYPEPSVAPVEEAAF